MGEREDIRVYIPLTDRFIDLFHHIALQMQAGTIMMGIRLVEENEPADLILRLEENEPADLILHFEGGERGNLSWVSFEPMDSTCQDYGLKRIPHAAPLEVQPIYFVLASAARFHWHLSHSSSQEKLAVTFKCTKLGEDTSKPYEYTNKPILVPQGDNLVKAGEITVDLDDRPSVGYGFKITNNCEYPLYAALFYFDMSDLSISTRQCYVLLLV
jgi:hypothetical protein